MTHITLIKLGSHWVNPTQIIYVQPGTDKTYIAFSGSEDNYITIDASPAEVFDMLVQSGLVLLRS